jgi:hypothetical protein
MYPGTQVDPQTAALLQQIKRRQRIALVGGLVLSIAVIVALLVWPDEIRDGVVNGASAVWRFLQLLLGGQLFG